MSNNNPHSGSNFDDFLREQGLYDDVTAKALKRAEGAASIEAAEGGAAGGES
jgi:antitoxin HicB